MGCNLLMEENSAAAAAAAVLPPSLDAEHRTKRSGVARPLYDQITQPASDGVRV